jgi:uncharacterized protein with PIN domain
MVIDSSALLSFLYREEEAESIADKIEQAPNSCISAPTLVKHGSLYCESEANRTRRIYSF